MTFSPDTLLITILIGLSGWTLLQVHKLTVQIARLEQRLDDCVKK